MGQPRTALVTGAGTGLGQAIAIALAQAGYDLALTDLTIGLLAETLAHPAIAKRKAIPVPLDLRFQEQIAAAFETARGGLGAIDVLVNNAGRALLKPVVDVTPDEWDDVFAVNVRGVYLVCRAFVPAMIDRGSGDVINLASVSGKRPLARRTPYCASKMAVIGLTTTLAAEVGPLGITVNSLSPGPVRGPRMDRNMRLESQRLGITVEEATERFVSRAALGRMLEEDEVGQAVVAMLNMPGLHAADIDLSAGMVAR